MHISIEASRIAGPVSAPPSKSLTQRTIACAALAPGRSSIANAASCDDALAAIRVAEALGAEFRREGGALIVRGGLRVPAATVRVSCGESGLALRMFSAIAALLSAEVELAAEGSLATRSVAMLKEPLCELGASCVTNAGRPPVRVRGPLRGGFARVDASESSQFLTGLLIALPLAKADSVLEVPQATSRGYLDLTIDVMRHFGVHAARSPDYCRFEIAGGQAYRPCAYAVEGDWSGAAFLLVAGAIAGFGSGLRVAGLSRSSLQPDRAVLKALSLAGARIDEEDGYLVVRGGALRGFFFDATQCPDLVPPLVALASACEGTTRLCGVSRLRGKESDRAAALVEEFGKIGLAVAVEKDELVVRPGGGPSTPVRGGAASSRGDHRIAMALAAAALGAQGAVSIDGAECVAKSYPGFFDDLVSIGATVVA